MHLKKWKNTALATAKPNLTYKHTQKLEQEDVHLDNQISAPEYLLMNSTYQDIL